MGRNIRGLRIQIAKSEQKYAAAAKNTQQFQVRHSEMREVHLLCNGTKDAAYWPMTVESNIATEASNQAEVKRGLSTLEAKLRLKQHGPNVLPATPSVSLSRRFIEQFRSPLIYVLLFALAVDLTIWFVEGHTGWPLESFAIALILLLNAGLGVYQESKAEAALARLKALAESFVWVMRDGHMVRLPSAELVPGDVVRIEAGDRIPADGKLIDGQGVLLDESVLTGESLPIEKAIAEELFSGTLLTRGKAYLEVTRTGPASAAGNLAVMIGAIEAEHTPLERRLGQFGTQIARWILLLAGVIAVGGFFIEGFSRMGHVLLFAVALAVAAVPEGLPAVLTLTLALGVERMAKKKAVVRRLSAVEALGQNEMQGLTLLFLYMTIGQLMFAYPARRIAGAPQRNIALHLSVILGTVVQLLTVSVPGLRVLLGLERLRPVAFVWLAGAILLSWGFVETYSRMAAAKSARSKSEPFSWMENLGRLRRVLIAIVGCTVLLVGIDLLVLPGPAFIVIPLGLAILATEFVWARALLKKARDMFPKTSKLETNSLRHRMN
jgi:hypothetical protein